MLEGLTMAVDRDASGIEDVVATRVMVGRELLSRDEE